MQVADFMGALKNDLEKRPKYTDPNTSLDEIDKKLRACSAEVGPILLAPKPKEEEPKKEEEKKEDKPAEEQPTPKSDEPMDNAGAPSDSQPAQE